MSEVSEQKVPIFMTKENVLGNAFEIYDNGDVVENPFTGEKIKLNALELSIYDVIKGCEYLASGQDPDSKSSPKTMSIDTTAYWGLVREGLSWFRENNAKAYMVLLD